jgi:hypothetical protein
MLLPFTTNATTSQGHSNINRIGKRPISNNKQITKPNHKTRPDQTTTGMVHVCIMQNPWVSSTRIQSTHQSEQALTGQNGRAFW